MSAPLGKLVVHYRSQAAAVATLDGFFLMRCFGDLSADDIRATMLGHSAVTAIQPEGTGAIVAVDSTAGFPSEEARRAMMDVKRQTSGQVRAHVLVVLGEGFWASAMRGVMTTIVSLTPGQHPNKVVRHEEEGVDWLLDTLKESAAQYRQALLSGLAQLKQTSPVPLASKPPR